MSLPHIRHAVGISNIAESKPVPIFIPALRDQYHCLNNVCPICRTTLQTGDTAE